MKIKGANRKHTKTPITKIDKSKVRGKYVRKEEKKIEKKEQTFQRPTPTPPNSIAKTASPGLMML